MKVIKRGDKCPEVNVLQRALSGLTCYFKGEWDSIFGKVTEAAVKRFQQEKGLVVDGIVGPKTWEALKVYKDDTPVPETAHFKMYEFMCKNGTTVPRVYWNNLQVLMNRLEEIRAACGNRRITVNSGYRTPAYNKQVGGASRSQHLYALAADITVEGVKPTEVYKIADKIVGSKGGVGKYKTFTHVDCRKTKARW